MSDNYDADTAISQYEKDVALCNSNRQNAYFAELGGWAEQLDMIYHDIDGWKAKVLAIKTRFPKPVEQGGD